MNFKITVFTPTYNRGYIISQLYESLLRQTFSDFEWVVVDDGSTDDTEKMIKGYVADGKISIKYKKVNNGGKLRAINRGVKMASGELFFIVDSDDYITDDALELINKWEKGITDKNCFAGVSGNRGNKKGKMWGTTFDGEFLDCTALERKKNNITGDKAEVYYTDILKKHPFPEIEEERYIPLGYVWYGMANDGYKIRWFNKIIYIGEYLEDGLTHKYQSLMERNPKGYALYKRKEADWCKYSLKMRINSYFQYFSQFKGKLSNREIAENLKISSLSLKFIILRFRIRNFIKNK